MEKAEERQGEVRLRVAGMSLVIGKIVDIIRKTEKPRMSHKHLSLFQHGLHVDKARSKNGSGAKQQTQANPKNRKFPRLRMRVRMTMIVVFVKPPLSENGVDHGGG